MIVRPSARGLVVINQVEHARLAGRFAEQWGNRQFARPTPFAEMVLTALSHDDGWIYRDRRPVVNPRTRRPSDFYELPMGSILEIHRDTVKLTKAEVAYTAMMVSMHRTGLCRGRYSTQRSWESRSREGFQTQVKKFVTREEAQQARIRRVLLRDTRYGNLADDGHVWTNYKLIQVWDRLSLYVCGAPVGDQVSPAPTSHGAPDANITLTRLSKSRIGVRPWPFATRPLAVNVDAKVISDREYADSDDIAEEMYSSPTVSLRFELK